MVRRIPLTKGKWAKVDDVDFERINAFKWCASNESRGTKWYAIRFTRNAERGRWTSTKVRMHHYVLDIAPQELMLMGKVVHHVNGDGLDNRRENLEVVSQSYNMQVVENWKRKKST